MLTEAHGVFPPAHLRFRGCCPEPAGFTEVRVDHVLAAERRDLVDGVGGGSREPQPFFGPERLHKRGELRPPRECEAAVPTRRAAAADLLLEYDDIAVWLPLLYADRCPEADVAAPDDRDVCPLRALQRRFNIDALQRLPQP